MNLNELFDEDSSARQDIFDPPQCNFDLGDSLNNDWLAEMFSSSPLVSEDINRNEISQSRESNFSIDSCQYDDSRIISADEYFYNHNLSDADQDYDLNFLNIIDPNDAFSSNLESDGNSQSRVEIPSDESLLNSNNNGCHSSANHSGGSSGNINSSNGCVNRLWIRMPPDGSTRSSGAGGNVDRVSNKKRPTVVLTGIRGLNMKKLKMASTDNYIYKTEPWIQVHHGNQGDKNQEAIDLSMKSYEIGSYGGCEDPCILPPSPPNSSLASSDTESVQSPASCRRTPPLNYVRYSPYPIPGKHQIAYTLSEALFSSPAPSEGLLMLTDEEKNTLLAEGYPVPTKLPLEKNEEKFLKKIRRKIKNKISAQESRRKKKEYMDNLEIKVQKFCHENSELLKKVEVLESNNRSLMAQLQNLQNMVNISGTTKGGTYLMVLVLFFAAFIGTWSPLSCWSVGYSRILTSSSPASHFASHGPNLPTIDNAPDTSSFLPIGPDIQHPLVDNYNVAHKSRSRVLVSLQDDDMADDMEDGSDPVFGPSTPVSYSQSVSEVFIRWWTTTMHGRSVDDGQQNLIVIGPSRPVTPTVLDRTKMATVRVWYNGSLPAKPVVPSIRSTDNRTVPEYSIGG